MHSMLIAIGTNLQYLPDTTPLLGDMIVICSLLRLLAPFIGYLHALYISPKFEDRSAPIGRMAAITFLSFMLAVGGGIVGGIIVSFLPTLDGAERAEAGIHAELTNSFNLTLPAGFVRVNSRFFTYRSMDGGGRVYLERLDGDFAAATSLLQLLEQKHITVTHSSSTESWHAARYAAWWHPEEYGMAIVFHLNNELSDSKRPTSFVVFGALCNTPTNRVLFIQMHEYHNDDYRPPK